MKTYWYQKRYKDGKYASEVIFYTNSDSDTMYSHSYRNTLNREWNSTGYKDSYMIKDGVWYRNYGGKTSILKAFPADMVGGEWIKSTKIKLLKLLAF